MATPYTSTDFTLQRVTVLSPTVVRVRFTYTPKKADDSAADDATNPDNHTLSGPATVTVVAANIVTSDPLAIDVYTSHPLTEGLWTVTVSGSVEMVSGTPLANPRSLSFVVGQSLVPEIPNGGAKNDGAAEIIRKHLPTSFEGPGWDAIIAAVATGDDHVWETAQSAFDQLFVSSASGIYLESLAESQGVTRPSDMGMSDASFRMLTSRLRKQVTHQALNDVLEVFYGPEAVSAYVETTVGAPFDLEDGWTLTVGDGDNVGTITIDEDRFTQVGLATADEVAVALTDEFSRLGLNLRAVPHLDPESGQDRVRVFSNERGVGSTVRISGGLALNALRFPDLLDIDIPTGSTLSVTIPEAGVARYSLVSVVGTPLLSVREGDVVNVTCQSLATVNRGSFTITNVRVVWTGAAYQQFFEVNNPSAVTQAGPIATLSTEDLLFFRPLLATLQTNPGVPVLLSTPGSGSLELILPATSQAVNREEFSGAYLQPPVPLDVLSATLTTDGFLTITTAQPHGLVAGGWVFLDGLLPSLTAPATVQGDDATTGNPGTTDTSQMTLWSSVRSDLGPREDHMAATLSNGDVLVTGGYRGDTDTYLSDCAIFRITGSTVLASGAAKGRTRHTYNWDSTVAAINSGGVISRARHRLDALYGSLAGRALLTGGRDATDTGRTTAILYDSVGDSWSNVPNGSLTGRYGHASVRVEDAAGDDVVVIAGGLSDATTAVTAIQRFTSTGGGTLSTVTTESEGRFRTAAVAADDTTWMVVGGARFVVGVPTPRGDCLAYDEDAAAWVSIGTLAVARMDHALARIGDGVVMAVGGYGRSLTRESVDRVLDECEVVDLATGRWRPAGRLAVARRNPTVMVSGGKVYVSGGTDSTGSIVTRTEVYDVRKGRWGLAPATATHTLYPDGAVALMDEGVLFHHGGAPLALPTPSYDSSFTYDSADPYNGATSGAPQSGASVMAPGADVLSTPAVDGLFVKIESIPTPTTVVVGSRGLECGSYSAGDLTVAEASNGVYAGPFVWDIDGSLAVTSVDCTLAEDLAGGAQYGFVTVDSTDQIPDEVGWIVFGFGTATQEGPVRYLGRVNDTTLKLDYAHVFVNDVLSGSTVTLLHQREPFDPPSPETVGSCYLTASPSGRIAAQDEFETSMAEGVVASITVAYPGDRGLGNAGGGSTGQKPSDQIVVWGADDLEQVVADAAEGA